MALDQQPADAGAVEDQLDRDRARQRRQDREADAGRQRQQRVAQAVAVDHPALARALGAGGAHVVAAHDLEQRGAGQPAEEGGLQQRQRQRRQEDVVQAVPEALAAAVDREPAEVQREHDQQERARGRSRGSRSRPASRSAARCPGGGCGGSRRRRRAGCRAAGPSTTDSSVSSIVCGRLLRDQRADRDVRHQRPAEVERAPRRRGSVTYCSQSGSFSPIRSRNSLELSGRRRCRRGRPAPGRPAGCAWR